jgi:hypothetical protein
MNVSKISSAIVSIALGLAASTSYAAELNIDTLVVKPSVSVKLDRVGKPANPNRCVDGALFEWLAFYEQKWWQGVPHSALTTSAWSWLAGRLLV